MHIAQKVVVVEANEVPIRVLERFTAEQPNSSVEMILKHGQVFRTYVHDVSEAALYPSQSWASFGTGVSYSKHKIYRYNDPKPTEYPFYWQDVASAGYSVGLVNTLHSSPLDRVISSAKYSFIIPDCFADQPSTLPERYSAFQAVNLKLTRANSRVSSLSSLAESGMTALKGLVSPSSFGISLQSSNEILNTVLGIVSRSSNKERLRNLQFPLIAEIFLRELKRTDVDLGIVFTNHVAANQHRYWYALFPEDFDEAPYPDTWVERYRSEILNAVSLLDRYLARLVDFCLKTDRMLVLCSSMGQRGNRGLVRDFVDNYKFAFRLEDPPTFISTLIGSTPPYRVETAMVPQYPLVFEDASAATEVLARLNEVVRPDSGIALHGELNGGVLTLTVELNPTLETYHVGGRELGYEELGFSRFETDDHHSGKHHPEGSLIIFNDHEGHLASRFGKHEIDYLEFAPAMRSYFLDCREVDSRRQDYGRLRDAAESVTE